MLIRILITLSIFISFISGANAGALTDAMTISSFGVKAQSERMKVVTQNIANADSTATTPEGEPYRRKIITFRNKKDPKTGAEVVVVDKISRDFKNNFTARYDPYHPAANAEGYILIANVEKNIETVDMKEAERGYQANLGAIETSKSMFLNTLDLLR